MNVSLRITLNLAIIAVFALPAGAATITFAFDNKTEFDDVSSGVGAPIGTTMIRDGGNPADAITITTVDARAPTYDAALNWDGTTYNLSGTSIRDNGHGVHIRNGGTFLPGSAADDEGINRDEIWTIQFDKAVVIDILDFNNIGGDGEQGQVTVAGGPTFLINLPNLGDGGGDDKFDPFSGLVIPAGTDIKFEGLATTGTAITSWRVRRMTVTEVAVPEPSSLGLGLLSLLAMVAIRRRKK